MMSNRCFPAELLDHVVDHLHDTRDALERCCLVSKSWVPRAREHLFADIEFRTAGALQSWKNAFPDPSTSPARFSKSLAISYPDIIAVADPGESDWILAFSRVVRFAVNIRLDVNESRISLVPFHGFSPAIKSLSVLSLSDIPSPQIYNLIHSFPLLQDISVSVFAGNWVLSRILDHSNGGHPRATVRASSPSACTGYLRLSRAGGMSPIASQLLSLPCGLHFRELTFAWNKGCDVSSTMALVEKCCSTVESLYILHGNIGDASSGAINLSKATKLKDAVLWCKKNPRWIVATLRTITLDHRNLRELSLNVPQALYGLDINCVDPANFGRAIGDPIYREWLELDHLLVQLWESHSIRPKVTYIALSYMHEGRARSCMESLLPEVTTRGAVDLVERKSRW